MRSDRPVRARLVVLTPVFNEAENLQAYCEAVSRVLFSRDDLDAEILFVDDGSSDASWKMIETACALYPRQIKGLRLSRNFGAHLALAAGFDHVRSDADIVATLACDLQDPPETVISFVEKWRNGADIVWGARRTRLDTGWRKVASGLMERVLRRFAMPRGSKFRTGSFLLMDRRVLNCFLQYREHNRVTFALVAWTGFDQSVVEYDRQQRVHGQSGWSFWAILNTAYDVFIGFSPLPAKFLTGLGFSVFLASIMFIIYIMVIWFMRDVQPGWTGIMATLTFFFGLLFMMVGMIAEYLFRIFIETKSRPLYFIASRTPDEEPEQGSHDR